MTRLTSGELERRAAAVEARSREVSAQEQHASERARVLDLREAAVRSRESDVATREKALAGQEHPPAGDPSSADNLSQMREANEHLVLASVHAQSMTEQADEANRLKDQFLATVSHELRTPLNAVLGWARMLASQQLKPERRAHAVATIERNAAALAHQIDDLLDVTRIIAGTLELNLRRIDLVPVVRAACDSIRMAAADRQLIVECDCGPGSDTPIVGDVDRLEQVLWNLLANGVKFTPVGGRIDVRVYRTGPDMRIEVADTGTGIAAKLLPHVFERFRRGGHQPTTRTAGLGLGLAIVRQLVELHGGSVHAESGGEGLGTRFTVILPIDLVSVDARVVASEVRAARSAADAVPQRRLDGVRILAVEDNEDGRELLALVLGAAGATVTIVGTAQEAFAALSAAPPDVLISDIGLAGEDGYALMRRIRQLEAERGGFVPAIAITGYAFPDDRRMVMEAGFQACLTKPVEPVTVTNAVAALLGDR